MCGIALIHGRSDETMVQKMAAKLQHRGPDGSGVLRIHHDTVLGHVRLSILDAAGGGQPMSNERGDLTVTFNGEIYNHLDLRLRLHGRHVFKTRSDTEVLLHLYEEQGEDMLRELDGMFALALAGPNGVLLARDPVGIKPLYYARIDGSFLAASELKAFPSGTKVRELPAGHAVTSIGEPWRFAPHFPPHVSLAHPPVSEALHEVRRRLEQAVIKRMMADVPVGVLLSGGLDSSIVAAMMKPAAMKLHSFTAGMAKAPDLDAAREIASFLGTEHHEMLYEEHDIFEAIPNIIYHLESFDAPLVRSAIPMYFICRLASRHVKVVLTGEGADELFAGYSYLRKFPPQALRQELDKIIGNLQNTNLQRADRISMAHGLEARVPFLDMDLLRYVARLPVDYLAPQADRPEKWILREACKELLPPSITKRRKLKFSEGAGSADIVARRARSEITAAEFEAQRKVAPGLILRSPEELYYYRIWRDWFGGHAAHVIGRTADMSAAT